jgi:hypothetical protein
VFIFSKDECSVVKTHLDRIAISAQCLTIVSFKEKLFTRLGS